MFDLTNKRALVTGSSQGIGFAIAKCFAAQGADVVIHGSRSYEKCAGAAEKIYQEVHPSGKLGIAVADLSVPDGADKLYDAIGDVDILVLNASVQFRKPWREITPDEMETQLQTNLKSSMRLIQLCEPYMEKNAWGRILTVGSVQQHKPHRDMAFYAVSKAGQMNLVENLAKQLAPLGITINNLAPGVIDTPRNEAALNDPEYSKKVLAGIPAGYAGTADDLAGAALLLCSNEGRYITGSNLDVDGGMKL